jgi:hypothetical protein
VSVVSDSVVDRHQNDADPGPDPSFHFAVDRNPDLDLALLWKIIYFFTFIHESRQCQFSLLYLSLQRHRCHNLPYFRKNIEIKKCNLAALALHLTEMDPDPDRQTSCLDSRYKKIFIH